MRAQGGARITSEDVATIVMAYGLSAAQRGEIVDDARTLNPAGMWDRPLPGVPEEMGVLASYAKDADSVTNWSVTLVPGLLQIEAYAMAYMRTDCKSPEDARVRWEARKRRQRILGTLEYTAYIYETALRIPFGGPASHRE